MKKAQERRVGDAGFLPESVEGHFVAPQQLGELGDDHDPRLSKNGGYVKIPLVN
jgi:hypothetical protein